MLKHIKSMSFWRWIDDNFNLLKNPYLNGMEKFKPDIPESMLTPRLDASIEDFKFIFSQVQNRVKETADEGDRLNAKSLTIIAVCLTLITALIGYLITNLKSFNPLTGVSIYVLLALWNVCVSLKKNVYPITYRSIGSQGKDLLKDDFFVKEGIYDSVEKRIIHSEIVNYEGRIQLNVKNNEERNKRVKKAFDRLFEIPLFCVIVYLILVFFWVCIGYAFNDNFFFHFW